MSNILRKYERRMLRAKGLLPAKRRVRRTAYRPWTKALVKMFEVFKEKQKVALEQQKSSVKEQLKREVEDGEKEPEQKEKPQEDSELKSDPEGR